MADIRTKYPSSSSVAITLTLASLASDSTMLIGRASTAVDNTTNLDIDHLVSGTIRLGTTPVVGKVIEIWAYSIISESSGTPDYPDGITGTDAAKTMTSVNVKFASLRIVASITSDATSDRDFSIPPVSIAGLFGGLLPPFWGLWVVHDTGVALNATQVALQYTRVQGTVA